MSAVNYSFYLQLNNFLAHSRTSNMKKQLYLRLILFIYVHLNQTTLVQCKWLVWKLARPYCTYNYKSYIYPD